MHHAQDRRFHQVLQEWDYLLVAYTILLIRIKYNEFILITQVRFSWIRIYLLISTCQFYYYTYSASISIPNKILILLYITYIERCNNTVDILVDIVYEYSLNFLFLEFLISIFLFLESYYFFFPWPCSKVYWTIIFKTFSDFATKTGYIFRSTFRW